jgi:hypothetical protein
LNRPTLRYTAAATSSTSCSACIYQGYPCKFNIARLGFLIRPFSSPVRR